MAIDVLLYCAETIILSKRLSPVFVEFLSRLHRDLTEFGLLSFCQYLFDTCLHFAILAFMVPLFPILCIRDILSGSLVGLIWRNKQIICQITCQLYVSLCVRCATSPPLEGLGEVNYALYILHYALTYMFNRQLTGINGEP